MPAWLYQMSVPKWTAEEYRLDVWEGKNSGFWQCGKIVSRDAEISKGDVVVFFFPKSRNSAPGIYGWGIVLRKRGSGAAAEFTFRPTCPSDFLKVDPVWDKETEELVNRVRGAMAQGTMWAVKEEDFSKVREFVRLHRCRPIIPKP